MAVALAQRDAAVARAEEIEAGRQAMVEQFRLLSHEVAEQQRKSVDTSAQQRLQATEQLLAPVAASLKEFQARLTDVEKERVQIATEMRSQVRTVRDAGEAMRREAATLVNALRKPQVRGSWGETTLKNVARLSGMVERCDFDLQVTTQSDDGPQRPDMRVNLADGKHVFVDSKVPLSAFLDAAGSEDDAQKAAHLRPVRAARPHPRRPALRKQYWKAAESPEFVVLFLPSEEFFSAALDQMPDLYEYAVKKDVVIATPTTLIGMLRAISYGWKQAALADKAAEVFKLGRELHERLGQMGASSTSSARALASAVNAYNETVGTVEARVMVSARRFRDLQVSEGELAPLQAVEAPVRQIQAQELVDDAAGRADRRARPTAPSSESRPEAADADLESWCASDRARAGRGPSLRGLELRGLRQRRLLRPVHGALLRAARAAVRRPGRACRTGPGARRRLRPGRPHRGAGRSLRRRPGRRDRPVAGRSSPLPASPAARRRRPAGRRRVAPLRRRLLRRRARPARRPLHGGPGGRAGGDGPGHPAGGPVAACVWDHGGGRGPLSPFWYGAPPSSTRRRRASRLAPGPGRATSRGCSARPGWSTCGDGELSVTIGLDVVRGLVGALTRSRPARSATTSRLGARQVASSASSAGPGCPRVRSS